MNIIDYSKNPEQVCFEATTEEESILLSKVRSLLMQLLPPSVIDTKKGNDFLLLNV